MPRELAVETRIANCRSRLGPLCFFIALAWFAVIGCGSNSAPPPAKLQATTPTSDPYNRPADGADWPAFLGPTGDGKSSQTGILLDWPANGPPVRWQAELGSGYGGAVVSEGRLFIFDRMGDEARLRCLDSVTGNEIMGIIDQLHAEGQTIIIVTHEESIAARCHRVIRLMNKSFRMRHQSQNIARFIQDSCDTPRRSIWV